jgi:hypothetical protein
VLFNSFSFILVFVPVVLIGSWLIRSPRHPIIFWTFASWTFCGLASPWFVLLMMASTVLDFLLAQRIARSTSPPLSEYYPRTKVDRVIEQKLAQAV